MINIQIKFKVASVTYEVEFVDNVENGEAFGQTLIISHKILIANRIKERDEWMDISEIDKINTFYHELFHVFHYYMDTHTPEPEAQTYANFMLEYTLSKKDRDEDKEK